MTTFRACQDVNREFAMQSLRKGFQPITYLEKIPVCVRSSVSHADAKARLENVIKGFCEKSKAVSCLVSGDVRYSRVSLWDSVVELYFSRGFSK